jgi:hypothetical protein
VIFLSKSQTDALLKGRSVQVGQLDPEFVNSYRIEPIRPGEIFVDPKIMSNRWLNLNLPWWKRIAPAVQVLFVGKLKLP